MTEALPTETQDHWLVETWRLIDSVAKETDTGHRVILTVEGCRALLAERAARTQWQPMETCPPAPTKVLLWFPALGYPVTGTPEAYGYRTGGWKATGWMPAPDGPAPDVEGKPDAKA